MSTVDTFNAFVKSVEAEKGYVRPAAFAVGIACLGANGRVLDTYYPVVNFGENFGAAAVLAHVAGYRSGSKSIALETHLVVEQALGHFEPFLKDGKDHPNIRVLQEIAQMLRATHDSFTPRRVVATFIGDLKEKPVDAHDVYLRLHLLSHRKVKPHGLNLDGIFGLLNNVVWTNCGPFDPDTFEAARLRLRAHGTELKVHSVDKFPRMTDYVIPSGVRIADADRVRLGAYLAEGTTVMHEGFVNFNAGTLGKSMVEGRVSAGVVVGNNSDIGGGASIMGTLSGGGKEVVKIGESCLLGANSGLGISLGNNCTVEAGLYITAGAKVRLPNGHIVKARELSGWNDIEFRRNSMTGAIEVNAKKQGEPPNWGGLNAVLHAN